MDRNPSGSSGNFPPHLDLLTLSNAASSQEAYDSAAFYQTQPPWGLPTWYPTGTNYQHPLRKPTDFYGNTNTELQEWASALKPGESSTPRKLCKDEAEQDAEYRRKQNEQMPDQILSDASMTTPHDMTLPSKSTEVADEPTPPPTEEKSKTEEAETDPENTEKSDPPADDEKSTEIIGEPQQHQLYVRVGKTYVRWKVAPVIYCAEDQDFALHLLSIHDKYCKKCKVNTSSDIGAEAGGHASSEDDVADLDLGAHPRKAKKKQAKRRKIIGTCKTKGKLLTTAERKRKRPLSSAKLKVRTCGVCAKIFQTRPLMKRHMRTHMDTTHTCKFCKKVFTELRYLSQHMAKHIGTLYRCKICDRGFTHRSNLSRHKFVHTGEKPHQCDLCGKCFAQKNDLNAHKVSHTAIKKYRCEKCDKAFMYRAGMTRHLRTHSDLRSYVCQTCGKSFKTGSNLSQHKKIHTGGGGKSSSKVKKSPNVPPPMVHQDMTMAMMPLDRNQPMLHHDMPPTMVHLDRQQTMANQLLLPTMAHQERGPIMAHQEQTLAMAHHERVPIMAHQERPIPMTHQERPHNMVHQDRQQIMAHLERPLTMSHLERLPARAHDIPTSMVQCDIQQPMGHHEHLF